jgi:hypothetical protein
MSLKNKNALDLDIGNYSIKDLEKFFRLKPGYTVSDIEYKEVKMRELLLKTGHVPKENKGDLIEFLSKAKEWLIFVKCGPAKKPTTLPVEPRLDKTEYNEPTGKKEDQLIERTPATYVNTFASEYYAGTLNPLATRTIKRCLTIDTRFRDNFYATQSSDFTFQLPIKLYKVVAMQMASAEIPIAFYGISKSFGNTHIWLEITYDESGVETTTDQVFVIAEGNYNAADFISALNAEICPTNPDGSPVDPNNAFSYIKLDLNMSSTGSGNGKVSITPSGSKAYMIKRIKMDFSRGVNGLPEPGEITSKIGWNLGFTKRVYDGSTNYLADTIVEPATIRYIYLAVDDFNNSANNTFITAFNQSILNPNILARISVKGRYFNMLTEDNLSIVSEPRKYFGPVDIQRLRIRLYDDFGRILDMNNANFSFCLVFTMMYDV